MASPQQDPRARAGGGSIVRSVIAGLCLLLGFLLTVPAVVAFWSNRTLLDTDRYVATVDDLSADPAVQAAIATKVGAAVKRNLDINALVADQVGDAANPDAAARAEARLRQAVPALVSQVTARVCASPQFQQLWTDANRELHGDLMAALSGDQEGDLSLTQGQLVLDITPMVDEVKRELADRGVDRAGTVLVPTADRQVVLMSSGDVAQAQRVYGYAESLSTWLIVIAALLYLAALLLARRRGLMVVLTGLAVAVSGAALFLALIAGRTPVQDRFADDQFAVAAGQVYETLVGDLRATALVMLAVGGAVAVGVGLVLWVRRRRRSGSPDVPGSSAEPKVPVDA